VERRVVEILEGSVLRVDLQSPRQVGRLAEELLVPPVAEAADALRDEEARRQAVGQ
jgi:hypothetical protein